MTPAIVICEFVVQATVNSYIYQVIVDMKSIFNQPEFVRLGLEFSWLRKGRFENLY